ncbi:MAG: PD40 domain-containing protein [Verrucomicrobia bacterium]|nr:PD40 domain-containing protein [Verrucomicrobiota bacterium]
MRSEFLQVLLVIGMAAVGFASILLGQPVEITITGQRGFPVALRGFQGTGGVEAMETLSADLRRSGRIRLQPTPAGAFTVEGSTGAGVLQGRVVGPDGRILLERKYNGEALGALAHRFADDAVGAITGVPGIAGSRFAFSVKKAGRKELYLCDADGANLQQVTRDNSISVSPALSRGARQLAYTGYLNGFADIYLIDLSTGRREKIVSEPGTNTGAAFSPGGEQIACTMSASGNPELFVLPVRGGRPKRLTHSRYVESSPCWSPDGRKIVFVSDATGAPQLFVIPAEGGRPQRIDTGHAYCVEPDWAPNGHGLAFNVREGGRNQVAVHDLRTGTTRVLTSGASAETPVWGADSQHLAYVQSGTLYVHDVESGTRAPVVSGFGEVSEPAWSR